jgi:hypothetical protein
LVIRRIVQADAPHLHAPASEGSPAHVERFSPSRRAAIAGLASCVVLASSRLRARATRQKFRNTLSVGTGVERILERGVVFSDGLRVATTVEDLQRLYLAHGSNEVYARIGTRTTTGNSLEQGLARARLAKAVDLPLSPEIGLWDTYGGMPNFEDWPEIHVSKPWESMTVAEMIPIVRDFGTLVARRLLATGVRVSSWNLSGDEHGIGGMTIPFAGPFVRRSTYKAPNGVDPAIGAIDPHAFEALPVQERISWYSTHLWPHTGRVLSGLAEGIRAVHPGARFSTHIGSSPSPAYLPKLITAFFEANDAAGYRVDDLGICFFPSSSETPEDRFAAFKSSITEACSALGRPMYIAEYAYPVAPVRLGSAETEPADWGYPTSRYPLSARSQADITRELVAWGARSGHISGIRQWAPDMVEGAWAPLSLFDLNGRRAVARPALNAVAEGLRQALIARGDASPL